MEMIVHLHPDVFEIVEKGIKNVEARVNDEKRRKLKIGDTLVFLKRPDEDKIIKTRVDNLRYFKSFEEMAKEYDFKRLYLEYYTIEKWLNELSRFYTKEEIEENGVVAIEFSIQKE